MNALFDIKTGIFKPEQTKGSKHLGLDACVHVLLGSFSNDDGDGRENATNK